MVTLSAQIEQLLNQGNHLEINLTQSLTAFDDSPALLFLKGLGFEKVTFFTNDREILQRWVERMLSYEQIFLADPDSLKVLECHWDEVDHSTGILHVRAERLAQESVKISPITWAVPPMLAPLGISRDACARFVSEIEAESSREVIARFSAILHEYKLSSQKIDPLVWSFLVVDVLSTALEARTLELAAAIAEEHQSALQPSWENQDRLIKVLAAYDPKASEVVPWAKIFTTLNNSRLLAQMESLLGSEAGPQALKLLGFRAQQSPDELAELCFTGSPFIQKILLQRLTFYWKPFHYGRLLNALETSLKTLSDEDLIRLWLTSLIRSSKATAFDDLEKIFRPRILRIFGERISTSAKRVLLKGLSELPSAECRDFLKKIRRAVEGDLADQVEKLLQGYREVNQ